MVGEAASVAALVAAAGLAAAVTAAASATPKVAVQQEPDSLLDEMVVPE